MKKNKNFHAAALAFGVLLAACGSGAVQASPLSERAVCAVQPGQTWLGEKKIREIFGTSEYLAVDFKISAANCYEFHAIKKNGDVVEAYYHPVTGAVVEHEVLLHSGGAILVDGIPGGVSPASPASVANPASAAHQHAGKAPLPAPGLVVY
ncbi:MAG: PepSY domain-containing protein [Polaromonas sp.]|nr:PepSY domain-containing protein [Polaromonas sp.]